MSFEFIRCVRRVPWAAQLGRWLGPVARVLLASSGLRVGTHRPDHQLICDGMILQPEIKGGPASVDVVPGHLPGRPAQHCATSQFGSVIAGLPSQTGLARRSAVPVLGPRALRPARCRPP